MKRTKKIFLFKKLLTLSFLTFISILSFGQIKTIKGVVSDAENGEILIGVSVVLKGTTTGIITNFNGEYIIEVPQENQTLVFTMVGMKSQEVNFKTRSFYNIAMESDSHILEQIIVTGYTTQKKADLTGAVSVIDVNDMMSTPENNPIKALQGRVAGMDITADGNPSGVATIRIRGVGTFNNNDPLFIIDGVPTKGGMHELNSNDIESIQVLKDASAASIYGSRAANGVIIITSKQGKKGVSRLNFDTFLTQSFYANKLKVLNTWEYGQALWQASVNSGENPNINNIGYNFNWGYDSEGLPILNNMTIPYFVDRNKTMLSSDTDWFDEITRKGLLQSYNLSASNGNEHGNYFFSVNYLNNKGIIKDTNFERFSARINSDHKFLSDKLTIGENFTINKTSEVSASGGVLDMALKSLPILPVYTNDGNWAGPTIGMQDRHNPARILDANKDNTYSFWRLFGNAYINLELIKGLNIKSNFGVDYGNFFKRVMNHSYNTGILKNDLSSITLEQRHWMKWVSSNTVTYSNTFGKHQVDGLAGIELIKERNIEYNAYKDNFLVETPEQMWPDMGIGKSTVTGWANSHALVSYFGNIGYVYDNRYLGSVTLRRDGSSRFGINNRYATFPAFSAGWRISQESFMENTNHILSDLKLRIGWGQTGNQEIGNYAVYTKYITDYGLGDPTWGGLSGTAYDFEGKGSGMLSSGYRRTLIGNPDLKWETTTQTNIGLDYGLLSQKIYGSLELYLKETDDILILPPYLAVIGEGGDKWVNGASMENKGIEFTLGIRDKFDFGLSYDIVGNIAAYRNKVTKLPEEVENAYGGNGKGDNILGHPINSFYGYVADGIFRTQEEVDEHADQPGKAIGRIRYKNLNPDIDNVINEDDRQWIGINHPKFTSGLNINLAYKGFDLIVFFQGVYGIDINTYDVKSQTDFWSVNDVRSNKGTRLLNAWSESNPNSNIPALTTANTNDEGRFSTYFIENGSYLKLRNLQLGYSLPQNITHLAGLNDVRFYISGQNLMTLKSRSFTGVDPENAAFGYPIPLTWTVGLNVTL